MRFLAVNTAIVLAVSAPALAQDWSWIHPRPQGHTLNDIVFLDDNTAIAVGECGTVLVTHDTGTTWSVRSKLFTVLSFNAIDRLDANSAVVVGDAGFTMRTFDQGANWVPVSTANGATLQDVSFFDANHGIAVGGLIAVTTNNGGFAWQITNLPAPCGAVDMVSATDAYAVGTAATILKTADGGASWAPVPSPLTDPATAPFISVDFLDPLHGAVGAATGDDGFSLAPSRCYVTADGGNTWTPSDLHYGLTHELFFPNELLYPQTGTILIAGRVECCVLSANDPPPTGEFSSTVNTGGSWTHRTVDRPANGLARNSDGVVMVVGELGTILRRNPDATYTAMGGGSHDTVRRSAFADATTGILMSSDGDNFMYGSTGTGILRSTDGGHTWSPSTIPDRQCYDLAFLSPTEVIAVGSAYYEGAVIRSTNVGESWTTVWTGPSPSTLRAVAAGSGTRAIAVGNAGTALVIDNGVVTAVPTGGSNFSDVAFASPTVVLAVGATDARSADGGLTWTPIVAPSTAVYALAFATATRAFGIDATGLLRTDDTGSTWAPVLSFNGLRGIAFADASHGMAVGDNGAALVTTDGGTQWIPGETPTLTQLNSVNLVAPGHAFVSGARGFAFEFGGHPVPTLIQSLTVAGVRFGAELRWDVVADENLSGFSIVRSGHAIAEGIATSARSFRDDGLTPGATYEYQLLAVDRDGSYTQSMPVSVTIPKASLDLLPNQPNPFNPETTIRFVVPEKTRVTLTVHDVGGRLVATLFDDVSNAGVQSLTWKADGVASGIYFARLRADKTEVSRKLVLLK